MRAALQDAPHKAYDLRKKLKQGWPDRERRHQDLPVQRGAPGRVANKNAAASGSSRTKPRMVLKGAVMLLFLLFVGHILYTSSVLGSIEKEANK